MSRGSSWIRIQFPEAFTKGSHTVPHTHTHTQAKENGKPFGRRRSTGRTAGHGGRHRRCHDPVVRWLRLRVSCLTTLLWQRRGGAVSWPREKGALACVSSLVPPGVTMGWAVVVVVACPCVGRDECRGRFDRARLFTHARTHARSRTLTHTWTPDGTVSTSPNAQSLTDRHLCTLPPRLSQEARSCQRKADHEPLPKRCDCRSKQGPRSDWVSVLCPPHHTPIFMRSHTQCSAVWGRSRRARSL